MSSIGKASGKGDSCSGPESFRSRASLSDEESELLRMRTGLLRVDCVCDAHFKRVIVFFSLNQTRCCDPFAQHKKSVTLTLTEIQVDLVKKCKTHSIFTSPLIPGKKLCKGCMKRCTDLIKRSIESSVAAKEDHGEASCLAGNQSTALEVGDTISGRRKAARVLPGASQGSEGSAGDDPGEALGYNEFYLTPPDTALSDLNKCLGFLGLDPIDCKKLTTLKQYSVNRIEEIKSKVIHKMERIVGGILPEVRSNDYEEMISQLQERFKTADKTVKLQILSVLPQSWSIRKICEEFHAPESMVRTMKNLVASQGIVPTPNPRVRIAGINEETIDQVVKFYHENSRMLPGRKDVVSVVESNKRVHKQKELVLLNLRELYLLFLEENQNVKISLTKFAQLRPAECVLAGAGGTHSVCVCVYHENFSLMLEATHLEKEVEESVKGEMVKMKKKMTIRDVFGLAVCSSNPFRSDCCLGNCQKCPDVDQLREMIQTGFDLKMQTSVEYKKWVTVDRAFLETYVKTVDDFIENFLEELPVVLKHHFIAISQNMFLKECKENLAEDECIVTGDFSENYTPVIQNEIQKAHWSKKTTPIHPFVCYQKVNSELKVLKFVVMSDCQDHTNMEVYAFQQRLIPYLKEKIPQLKKIRYFSDGAASQYKNRSNALNLRLHYEDFAVLAEWHFFASCHGKGPCDGVGGTVKRECARESLQRIKQNPITTPEEMYNWAKEKFSNSMDFVFVSASSIDELKVIYKQRFQVVEAAAGISMAHCIIPQSKRVIIMKEFSSAETCLYLYYGGPEEAEFEDFHGFVIVFHEESWQVAFVNARYENEKTVEVILLEQVPRKQLRFRFPDQPQNILICATDLIMVVNVDSDDNGHFKLQRKDASYASQKIQERGYRDLPKTKGSRKRQRPS